MACLSPGKRRQPINRESPAEHIPGRSEVRLRGASRIGRALTPTAFLPLRGSLLCLIQRVGRDMRENNEGRILITGSIAGFIPGSYQAVYNASKAFLDSFAFALRNELKDTDVTVTCLMQGATETEFFDRAEMGDTKIGASKKADPADVAKAGFEAMLNGEGRQHHRRGRGCRSSELRPGRARSRLTSYESP
jgi:NAD(P)-dependent dehydrogenase (short-subunit alcohol dehydrogenase family)